MNVLFHGCGQTNMHIRDAGCALTGKFKEGSPNISKALRFSFIECFVYILGIEHLIGNIARARHSYLKKFSGKLKTD